MRSSSSGLPTLDGGQPLELFGQERYHGRELLAARCLDSLPQQERLQHLDRLRLHQRPQLVDLAGRVLADDELHERRDHRLGVVVVVLAALSQEVLQPVPAELLVLEQELGEGVAQLRARVRQQACAPCTDTPSSSTLNLGSVVSASPSSTVSERRISA